MNYRTFLINLDRSVDRLAYCTQVLGRFNIKFERVAGVYGAELSEQECLASYCKSGSKSYYKELVVGELGCYLSHRKVWQKIVDENLDFAVVLEDDIDLTEIHYDELIQAICSLTQPWYYIKLAGRYKEKNILLEKQVGRFRFVTFKKSPSHTRAQVVSREGAKRLLANSLPFGRPVDVDLQYWWEKDIHIDALLPFSFGLNESVESEIHPGKTKEIKGINRLKQYVDRVKYALNLFVSGRRLKRTLRRSDTQ